MIKRFFQTFAFLLACLASPTAGALEPIPVDVWLDRSAFLRMEDAALPIAVKNTGDTALESAVLYVTFDGWPETQIDLPSIDPNTTSIVECAFGTTLRAGEYSLSIRLECQGFDPYQHTFSVHIVARRPPDRLPVVMWGIGQPARVMDEIERLTSIGFTHVEGFRPDHQKIWDDPNHPTEPEEPNTIRLTKEMLDLALVNDIACYSYLSPGGYLTYWVVDPNYGYGLDRNQWLRINRDSLLYHDPNDLNTRFENDICGLCPSCAGMHEYFVNVGRAVGVTYGTFPAFQAALVHTEMRAGKTELCFHTWDVDAYEAYSGQAIPEEVYRCEQGWKTGTGVPYTKLPCDPDPNVPHDFPENRVIEPGTYYPIYDYFQWFWKKGDGWNELNTDVHNGLMTGLNESGRSALCADVWTFHDPAVRVPSTYGSGGDVDVISHWSSTDLSPLFVGLAGDELLAMAAGAELDPNDPNDQRHVMNMTWLFWVRDEVAPRNFPPQAAWESACPNAIHITISPDHLREAFWAKIARPIQGIMFHGWESLVCCEDSSDPNNPCPCDPNPGPTEYSYTNAQTKDTLQELIEKVARPLGPTLLKVPGVKSKVAFLESFAAQTFAGRGTGDYNWGQAWCGPCPDPYWQNWSRDAYLVMQYAHLQPDIMYDETIEAGGLAGYEVLVMCDCDVVTSTMKEAIELWYNADPNDPNRTIIIGDGTADPIWAPWSRLAPAIRELLPDPNNLLTPYLRPCPDRISFADFLDRMSGPDPNDPVEPTYADLDRDHDVDLADFAELQVDQFDDRDRTTDPPGSKSKRALQALAQQVRTYLEALGYSPYVDVVNVVDVDEPALPVTRWDVIPYLRRYADTDYVFLVNDWRQFGDYVGRHGRVQEDSRAVRATVTVDRPDGHVYDLAAGTKRPAAVRNGKLSIDVELGPCDPNASVSCGGAILMITSQEIASNPICITGPQQVCLGAEATYHIRVVDPSEQPVEAVVPLHIDIRDPNGQEGEFSGYYAAVAGTLDLTLNLAPNDLTGRWAITVKELATRKTATFFFTLMTSTDLGWAPGFGIPGQGMDNQVGALAVYDDGTGPALYAGGDFHTAGGVTVNHIARWNGSVWTPLAGGMNNAVRALLAWNGRLYAGGDFTNAGGVEAHYIASWDGASWQPVGAGMGHIVYGLGVYDGALYAGGEFHEAGGVPANHIARWDGASWSPLGAGTNAWVHAIAEFAGELYAGGGFTQAGGLDTMYIARWNGSAWQSVGGGVNGMVLDLLEFDEDGPGPGPSALYVAGWFWLAGGSAASFIARWDGTAWSGLAGGMDNGVSALAVFDDDGAGNRLPALYAGGAFSVAGGVQASRVAQWTGSGWAALGSGTDGGISRMVACPSPAPALYVGGQLTTAGGMPAANITRWGRCASGP